MDTLKDICLAFFIGGAVICVGAIITYVIASVLK
jgi:hypothetical protein